MEEEEVTIIDVMIILISGGAQDVTKNGKISEGLLKGKTRNAY